MNAAKESPTLFCRSTFVALAASTLAMAGYASAGVQSAPQQQPVPSQHSKPAHQKSAEQSAEQVIRQWPSASQEAAKKTIQQYGQPDEVTQSMLVWNDNGPWVRTVVHKEPVQHNFPMPHEDVLEQVIAYEVPEEKFSELARFDGSIVANRTTGELSVRCDREAANFLALNLAHDIVQGARSVEDARSFYARSIQELMQGQEPEYVQGLGFETQTLAATADPDERVISEQVAASDRRQTGQTGQTTQTAQSAQSRQTGEESTTRTGGEESATRTAAGAAAATAAGTAGATRSPAAQGESIAAMLSRELSGKDVVSSDGEVVGEVAEIRSDDQGRHVARIDLGGFLGLGEEEMTLPLSELTIGAEGNVQTSMTRNEIETRQKQGESSGGKERR